MNEQLLKEVFLIRNRPLSLIKTNHGVLIESFRPGEQTRFLYQFLVINHVADDGDHVSDTTTKGIYRNAFVFTVYAGGFARVSDNRVKPVTHNIQVTGKVAVGKPCADGRQHTGIRVKLAGDAFDGTEQARAGR